MNMKLGDSAVSEIIGAIILLAIAVAVFSVIYINVLSDDGPNPDAFVTIIGKMESVDNITNTVSFENQRGVTLGPDTVINLILGEDIYNPIITYVRDFPLLNGNWNIGEKVYPAILDFQGDLNNVTIDANIVDKETNSIVFWGRLQEGYVVPPFGRGGIWHFNESYWNGTFGEVKDSSGNGNHGTAINGANTTSDGAFLNRSGLFDCTDDYVRVNTSYSLNIKNEITFEAWIKPWAEYGVLDSQEVEGMKFGYTPNLIHLYNYTYAVAGENFQKQGFVNTFIVNPLTGSITWKDSWFIGNGTSSPIVRPNMINVKNNVFAVAYIEKDGSIIGRIKTFEVNSNAEIIPRFNFTFNNNECFEPHIIHVVDDVFAIAYRDDNEDGWIKIININETGEILDIPIVQPKSFSDICYEPYIIQVSGSLFAIVYGNENNENKPGEGYIQTVSITPNSIELKNGTWFEPTSKYCAHPNIINVTNNLYAVTYSAATNGGFIKTLNISTVNGAITNISNRTSFTNSKCFEPDIIRASKNTFAIVYSTGDSSPGYFKTVNITSEGKITDYQDQITFNLKDSTNPDVLKVTNYIYVVAYENQTSHVGKVTTLRNLRDPTDPYKRGIFKAGAIHIYATFYDLKSGGKVYASVTTDDGVLHKLELPINQRDVWYHVALTYDGSIIKLYCNKQDERFSMKLNDNYISKNYKNTIKISSNDLLFGYKFFGCLDEIAIFDRALSQSEIQYHFENPEILESYS